MSPVSATTVLMAFYLFELVHSGGLLGECGRVCTVDVAPCRSPFSSALVGASSWFWRGGDASGSRYFVALITESASASRLLCRDLRADLGYNISPRIGMDRVADEAVGVGVGGDVDHFRPPGFRSRPGPRASTRPSRRPSAASSRSCSTATTRGRLAWRTRSPSLGDDACRRDANTVMSMSGEARTTLSR